MLITSICVGCKRKGWVFTLDKRQLIDNDHRSINGFADQSSIGQGHHRPVNG
jgi:hypothetical protein